MSMQFATAETIARGRGRWLTASLIAAALLCNQQESVGEEAAASAGKTSAGDLQETAGYDAFVKRNMPPLPPDAPKPSSNPTNLEGTWYHRDMLDKFVAKTMYGKAVPMTPKAQKILDHRRASAKEGKPIANASTRCLPPGHPWQLDLNFPFTILQTKRELYFVFEEFHGVWKIHMNQPHRKLNPREYMGDSVGHWDGGTLVVDTVDFKEPMWVDTAGVPLSRDLHMVQRIRKIDEDGPALEIITTIDDPAMYAHKWSMVRSFAWRPDKIIFAEYNCEQQVGAPDGLTAYGVVEE